MSSDVFEVLAVRHGVASLAPRSIHLAGRPRRRVPVADLQRFPPGQVDEFKSLRVPRFRGTHVDVKLAGLRARIDRSTAAWAVATVVSFAVIASFAIAPEPARAFFAQPWGVGRFVVGGLVDDAPAVSVPNTSVESSPLRTVATEPTAPQIDAWLSWYPEAGALAAYRDGSLRVRVAAGLVSRHRESIAGLFVDRRQGILISASTGWTPFVLAHEVGHWLVDLNPTVRAHGDAAAGDTRERLADCTAVVLLQGTPDEPEWSTDCRDDEVDLAALVIARSELPASLSAQSTRAAAKMYRTGSTNYAAKLDAYSPVDTDSTYPSRAYVAAARVRAGLSLPGAISAATLAAPVELTLEMARAAGTVDPSWIRAGVEVLRVTGLRGTWGADLTSFDGGLVQVIDQQRVSAATGTDVDRTVAAKFVAGTPAMRQLPDRGACWVVALAYAVRGSVAGADLEPTTPAALADPACTRQVLLDAAEMWVGAGLAVQAPAAPTGGEMRLTNAGGGWIAVFDAEPAIDPARVATERDWLDAIAAAGIAAGAGYWVPAVP